MQPIPTRRAPGRALLLAAAAAPLAAQFPNQFSLHFDQGRLPPATSPFNALLPACSSAQDVLLRDFDGDGDIDAYVITSSSDRYFVNGDPANPFADPQGRFFDESALIQRPANGATDAAAADMDNDGDDDVVIAITQGFGNGNVLFFRNDTPGTFRFVDSQTIQMPATLFGKGRAIAAVDWDGDGLRDILLGTAPFSGFPGGLFCFLNSPTAPGTFTPVPVGIAAVATPFAVESIAVGDVDGDGDPDLYCGLRTAGDGPSGQALVLNTSSPGLPGFADGTAASGLGGQTLRRSSAAAFADVDADGDLDLITASQTTFVPQTQQFVNGQEELYLNTGGGVFAAPALLPNSNDSTTDLELGDVDADGDLELITVNEPVLPLTLDGESRFYEFDPVNVAFVDDPSRIELDQETLSQGVAMADVDLDDDLDLFLANPIEGALHYLPNAARHLDAPRLVDASTGPTVYDIRTAFDVGFKDPTDYAETIVLLALPPTGPRVDVPGFGWFLNDPGAITISPTLMMPPGVETATLQIAVAQGTTLDFVLQGVVLIIDGPTQNLSWDVTNVVRTTIQ
ncbi:MAG: VCBS repeat-containing protein [Planctomycetes bacterium]|nr:VCBS repeat-containing protein [Planctomycetota bacterium]